jgi:hypothetical protein
VPQKCPIRPLPPIVVGDGVWNVATIAVGEAEFGAGRSLRRAVASPGKPVTGAISRLQA